MMYMHIPVFTSIPVVSGKETAWQVLGMVPSLRKSATLEQSDTWRKRRLRLHHAGLGLAHLRLVDRMLFYVVCLWETILCVCDMFAVVLQH